jgi:hypothetical protein
VIDSRSGGGVEQLTFQGSNSGPDWSPYPR